MNNTDWGWKGLGYYKVLSQYWDAGCMAIFILMGDGPLISILPIENVIVTVELLL
jgi:hypothetical protein